MKFSVQPLLFGGYESGPRVPDSLVFRFFGSLASSSRERKRVFGIFQRKVSPGCPKRAEVENACKDGGVETRVKPETSREPRSGKAPGRPLEPGRGARIEAGRFPPRRNGPIRHFQRRRAESGALCLCVKNSGPVKRFSLFHARELKCSKIKELASLASSLLGRADIMSGIKSMQFHSLANVLQS